MTNNVGSLSERVADVKMLVFAKSAERLSSDHSSAASIAGDSDDELADGVNLGLSIAVRSQSLGVRVRLEEEGADARLLADVAVEYDWDGPIDYSASEIREFIRGDGIPRALASASAILCDAATSVGLTATNHSFGAQGAVLNHFDSSFDDERLLRVQY